MKQRALIAAALTCEPSLLILDEPTTALDVTVEAQILDLLAALRRRKDVAVLFISHNLGVVCRVCDDVALMYAGQMVEMGAAARVLARPAHPYAKGLLASLPPLRAGTRRGRLPSIPGQMTGAARPETGCVFSRRCPWSEARCTAGPQAIEGLPDGHAVRCWKSVALGDWPETPLHDAPEPMFQRGDALLNLTDLRRSFVARCGLAAWRLFLADGRPRLVHDTGEVAAVDGVSLSVSPGKVLGLVGESSAANRRWAAWRCGCCGPARAAWSSMARRSPGSRTHAQHRLPPFGASRDGPRYYSAPSMGRVPRSRLKGPPAAWCASSTAARMSGTTCGRLDAGHGQRLHWA
jgi:peptide/nickel transport system ATP-binding protein